MTKRTLVIFVLILISVIAFSILIMVFDTNRARECFERQCGLPLISEVPEVVTATFHSFGIVTGERIGMLWQRNAWGKTANYIGYGLNLIIIYIISLVLNFALFRKRN